MFINIIKFGLSEGFAKLVPIITILVLAKSVSKEEIGLLSILVVGVEVAYIFISNNIQATTRIDYFKLDSDDFKKKTIIKIIYSCIMWLTVSVIFIILMKQMQWNEIYLLLIFLPILKTLAQLKLSIYQCSKQSNSYLFSQLVFVISYLLIFFFFHQYGLLSWVVGIVAATLCQCLFPSSPRSFSLMRNNFYDIRNTPVEVLGVIKQGLSFLPQALGWWLKSASERYIIGLVYGLTLLGVYSFSSQFSFFVTFLITAINLAMLPDINKSIKDGNLMRVNKIYIGFSLILILFSFFLVIMTLFFINTFYVEYYEGKYLVIISVTSALVQSLYMLVSNEIYFRGYESFVAKYTMLVLIIQVFLFLLMSKLFSLELSLLVSIFANLVLLLLSIKKIKEIRLVL